MVPRNPRASRAILRSTLGCAQESMCCQKPAKSRHCTLAGGSIVKAGQPCSQFLQLPRSERCSIQNSAFTISGLELTPAGAGSFPFQLTRDSETHTRVPPASAFPRRKEIPMRHSLLLLASGGSGNSLTGVNGPTGLRPASRASSFTSSSRSAVAESNSAHTGRSPRGLSPRKNATPVVCFTNFTKFTKLGAPTGEPQCLALARVSGSGVVPEFLVTL